MKYGQNPLLIGFAVVALFATGAARAQQPAPPPADPAKVLTPFLDNEVVAVVRIDLTRVDLKALEAWIVQHVLTIQPGGNAPWARSLKTFPADLQRVREEMEQGAAGFRAAGGREAFLLLDPANLVDAGRTPSPVLVPLGKDADADKLLALLGGKDAAERVGNAILVADGPARTRFRAVHDDPAKRLARPDLLAALAHADDAVIRVAASASPDTRKAFEQLAPTLPPQLGGGATAELTGGAKWAALSVTLPPKPAVRAVVQAADAKAAETLAGTLREAAHGAAGALRAMQKDAKGNDMPIEDLAGLLANVAPVREGDRVVVAIDDAGLTAIGRVAGVGLAMARENAMRVRSLSNIRQLVMACIMWEEAHGGEWPADLPTAMAAAKQTKDLAENPRDPKSGYTYVKPKEKKPANRSARIVLYESATDGDGRGVGFLDGHAEWMKEDAFQRALKAQEAQDKAAGAPAPPPKP